MSVGIPHVRRKIKRMTVKDRRRLIILGAAFTAAIVMLIVLIVLGVTAHIRARAHRVDPLTNDVIMNANIANADKLMIVAHPDDETLWGGGHLTRGGYLVVCVTGGRNEKRKEEFIKVVKASGNAPLILEYPDCVLYQRDDWSEVMGKITRDIDLLTGYKKWKQIVTHNEEGEYGHKHHKLLHGIVLQSCIANGNTDVLWYFGKYYTKSKLPGAGSELTPLDSETVKLKNKMLGFYETQKKTVDRFSHMTPYEEWQKAE